MMIIRQMTQWDIEQISELEKQCFADPWSKNAFTYELHNSLSLWLVCVEADRVLGYIGAQTVFPEADIMNVAVLPEYRRQGIGEKLIATLISMLKEQGVNQISLEVRASNGSAIFLYEKMGFFLAGRRPNYYRHPKEDALILRKELS